MTPTPSTVNPQTTAAEPLVESAGPRHRRPPPPILRPIARSGWVPSTLVVIGIVAMLGHYGVTFRDIAAFGAQAALCAALPGTLLWRALRRAPAPLAEDVAAGTALGYAMELFCYLPARALDVPVLVLLWPAVTIAAFLAVPRLRPYWRSRGERAPAVWSWTLATLIGAFATCGSAIFFGAHPIDRAGAPYVDMPVHLARAAELKHHMPPMDPNVLGEPLSYHWFTYAIVAATSWTTGIELQTLLYRLAALPMLATFVVLIAVIARRLIGRWWAGPVAVGIYGLALAPNPYGWTTGLVPTGDLFASSLLWLSPTQAFGAALFAGAMLPLVESLSEKPPPGPAVGRWICFAALLAAVMGTKATYLPMLAAGLLLVAVVTLFVQRRVYGPVLIALTITGICLVIAQFIIFGGESQGMTLAPFSTVKLMLARISQPWSAPAIARLCAIMLLCWALTWPGIAGLLRSPRRALDPPVLLLLGVGTAGIAALLLLGHPGASQSYFLHGSSPYLALTAACGLAAVPPPAGLTRRHVVTLAAFALAGAVAVTLVRAWPSHRTSGHAVRHLAGPYLVLVAVLGLGAAVAFAASRRPSSRGVGLAATLALTSGFALPAFGYRIANLAPMRGNLVITTGALEAGRWLRDHSAPDDVVATNAHCRVPHRKHCDNRHFWVAAYSERRVLVEGWGYTATSLAKVADVNKPGALTAIPFWDQKRLAANDAVFRFPSARAIARLRDTYGVRWLFVDETMNVPPHDIAKFARFRYRSGRCAVYQIPSPPTAESHDG